MSKSITDHNSYKRSRIIFFLSLLIFLYWSLARVFNIYAYAVAGALFEFLWLPVLLMMLLLPFLSAFFMFKEKFSFKSLYLYSIVIIGLAFILFLKPKRPTENSTAQSMVLANTGPDIGTSAAASSQLSVLDPAI